MLIMPAIDLSGGKCVRLYQGDFSRETVFSDDPVSTAKRWLDDGASTLHVVDLDGARHGSPRNLGVVEAIIRETAATVHFGGGLRSLADVERAFGAGVAKVNVGTALFTDPAFLKRLVEDHPGHVLAALDCRDGVVLRRGWLSDTGVPVAEAAQRLLAAGLADFVYTDAARDGAMSGPDIPGVSGLLDLGVKVIASGGVSSLDDVAALATLEKRGLTGIIVGRALYAGAFSLGDAIETAARASLGVR